MKYLVMINRRAAEIRSAASMQEAAGWLPSNVTQYRWSITENDTTKVVALIIPETEKDESRLSSLERTTLISENELKAQHPDWLRRPE